MRKFLAYMLTYVLMLFVGIGGVFLFTDRGSQSQAVIPVQEPSALDKVVSNLIGAKSINVNGLFNIANGQESAGDIGLDVKVNMIDGFEKLSVSGAVNINLNNYNTDIQFAYVDNNIYLSVLGAKICVSTSEVGELIGVISGVVSQFVPDFDIGSMLDINALMGLMSNIQEEKNENNIILKISTDFGDIEIITDLEYNIQKVNVPNIKLNDTSIQSNIGLNTYDELQAIDKPSDSENYKNVTEEINLLKAVVNTFSDKFTFTTQINELSLLGRFDLSNIYSLIDYKGYQLELTLLNNNAYLQFGDLKLVANGNDFNNLINIVKKYFVEFDNINIQDILLQQMNKIKDIDFSKIDLSNITEFIQVDENNNYHIVVDDIDVQLKLSNNKISEISTVVGGQEIVVNFEYGLDFDISKPSGEFVSATELAESVDAVVQTLLSDNVNISANVIVDDLVFNLNADYSFNGGNIYLNASLSYQDFDIKLYFVNSTLYFEYQGIKVKADKNSINSILDSLPSINSETLQDVVGMILGVLANTEINVVDSILSIYCGDNKVVINTLDGKVNSIDAQINNIIVNASINYDEFEVITPNDNDYVEVTDFVEIIENSYNLINQPIYAEINLTYDNLSVEGYLQYVDNAFSGKLNVNYLDYNIKITLLNNVVYAEAFGAKVKFNLNDTQEVIEFLKKFNIEMPEISQDINIDYNQIVGIIASSYVELTKDSLSVSYKDYNICVHFVDNCINSITVNIDKLNGSIKIVDSIEDITINDNEYLDIVKLLPFASSVYNTVCENKFAGNMTLSLNVNNNVVALDISYKIKYQNEKLIVSATTNYQGIDIELYFENNTIYLSIDDINIKANINEIDKIITFVSEQFNIQLNNSEVTEIANTIMSVLNITDLSFVNTIQVTDNDLSISLNGIVLYLEFTDKINSIKVDINNLNILDNVNITSTVEIGVNHNEFVISKPTKEYVDINNLVDIANSAINTIKDDAISGQIEITINDNNIVDNSIVLDYNYSYNNGNIKLDMSTTVLGDILRIVLYDNTVYVKYQGVLIKASINDILNYIPTNSFESFDIMGIVVKAIQNIRMSLVDNTLSVNYNADNISANINVNINNEYLQYVEVTTNYVNLNISFNKVDKYNDIDLSENYVEVNNLIELVENIIDIINGNIYTTFDANIYGLQLNGVLNYNNGEISASIATKVLNRNVTIRLIENVIYCDIDGMKVKFNLSDTSKVMELINEYFVTNNAVEITITEDAITKLLNSLYLTYNGNEIAVTVDYNLLDFGIDLTKYDLSNFNIDLTKIQSNTLNVGINCENNKVSELLASIDNVVLLNIKLHNELQTINLDTSGYLDIVKLLPFVKTFIDVYLSNGVNGQININVPQIENQIGQIIVDYKINFVNGLVARLDTKILNQNVTINIVNGKVYIAIDDSKYFFKLSEIDNIINLFKEKFNLAIDDNILQDFSLGDINIQVNSDKELQIVYKDFVINIIIDNEINVLVQYNDNTIQLNINKGLNQISEVAGEYLHIDSLINKVFNIVDLVNAGNIQLNIDANIDNTNINVIANIDFEDFIKTQNIDDLSVNARVHALDKDLTIKLTNSTLYVSIEGLNVQLNINDISTIVDFINKHFELNELSNINIDFNNLITNIISNENIFEIIFNDYGNIKLTFNNDRLSNIDYEYSNYLINAEVDYDSDKLDIILANNYSNVVDLLPLCDKLIEIYNSKALSMDAQINAYILGSQQTFNAGLNIDFNNSLKVDLVATLEGVEVALHLRQDILYLDIYGLRIKCVESDLGNIVEFLNKNFNLGLIAPTVQSQYKDGEMLIDFINKNFNMSINTNFDLGVIGSWKVVDNEIIWTLRDGSIINISTSNILDLSVISGEFSVGAQVVAIGQNVVMTNINDNDYVDINKILNEVQAIINTITTKQYDFVANAQVYNNGNVRYNVAVDAGLDIINGILFGGTAKLTGEKDIEVNLDYDNNYLYLNYDGLKVKINKQNLKEIAGIALSVFGIDISNMSIFDNIDFDFDLGNITEIMPEIDFGNPLSMLKVINSLNYSDGQFYIELNAKYITNSDNLDIMKVSLLTNDNKLTNINLDNIYTSENEYFNLQIALEEFKGLQTIGDGYIDISSASTLLKGIINTSELNNYHITGNLNIVMDVLGTDIDWNVPYDFQIKLVDSKPVVMANVGPMPVVPAVNNDVPYEFGDTVSGIYCGLDRKMTIYYLDGYVYFYRTEQVPVFASGTRTYEKKLKVALDTVLADPMKYMQYALGFTDSIMDAIAESMQLTQNRENPIDLGKVLLAFDHNDDYYNLTINLGEISNNPQLDTIYVGIKTSYIDSASKDYTTDLKFNMHMPFTDSIVMDLTTNDMKLVDIGAELDFSALYNYVNSYPYNEDEQWEANKGNWSLASSITYTINFVTNGGSAINSISQPANSQISLPTYDNRVVDQGDYRYTYRFDGWYTTENFEDSTLFNSTTMPRGDTTLYAKWTLISTLQVRNITFETNGGSAINAQKYLPDADVDLSGFVPTKATYYVDKGYNLGGSNWGKWTYEVTRYTFAGWYTDFSCTQAFSGIMPDYDITLYAKWNATTTTEYYYNWERP